MNLSFVAIIWFGGNKIISGSFQVGQLMSFITYLTQILMSLMMLSMTIMTLSRASASSERILEVLNTVPGIADADNAGVKKSIVSNGKIEFRNVYFKNHPSGNEYVLKKLSLTTLPGEIIVIIGSTAGFTS